MKLIDKDAVVAEIDRLLHENIDYSDGNPYYGGATVAYNKIRTFLDTLEVKKVDLEKKFFQWWKDERAKDYHVDILYEKYPNVSMKLARHFFELGLKTQMRE